MLTRGALLAEGRTSQVFDYGADSVVKVLRAAVPNEWADLEAHITDAVRARGISTPEVRGVIDVDGRPGIIFERIDGPSMWQLICDRPDRANELVRDLVHVQIHIQRSGPPSRVPDFIDRLCSKIDASRSLSDEDRGLAQTLARSLPRGAALLHGDLHPGNVLMGAQGPVVIDWFDAAVGHPVADVVRSSILLRSADRLDPPHLPGATPDMLRTMQVEYLSHQRHLLAPVADELWRWEAASIAGRLAERAQADEESLVRLWQRVRTNQQPSEALRLASVEPRADD